MKKIAAILLLTVYVSTAFGTAINFHYCNGHLTNVSILNFSGPEGCNCNPTDMPKDCCKDKLKYEKADNHNIIQALQISELTSFAFEPPLEYIYDSNKVIEASVTINPPDQRSHPAPIFLLNRVFRI